MKKVTSNLNIIYVLTVLYYGIYELLELDVDKHLVFDGTRQTNTASTSSSS